MRPLPLVALGLIVALAAPANAEEAAPTGVLTRAPELTRFVEAEYPPAAEEQGLGGDVVLEIDLSETGAVTDARVIAPAGHGFDEAALAAAKQFQFSPAEIDGKPAAVRIEYRYHFELKPEPPPPPPVEPPPGEVAAPEKPGIVNLRGRIVTRGTKEPVVGASVDVGDGAQVVTTDKDGRFEATDVPLGYVKLVVEDAGHERFETSELVEPGKATEVTYYLRKKPGAGFEAVVVGQREKKEVATVELSVGEITRIPGVSGDTVKVVQNLPGVARPPAGAGLLVVRGGNPNDTKVYIDGQIVPLIFHFGGLNSVYASELVEEVQFEPGNFGARYGRATAGRVELISRDPKLDRLHLVVDADLFDATAFVETPVSEDVSVAVAARRSYVDGVLVFALRNAPPGVDVPGFTVAPRYWDYQAKATWKLSETDTLRLQLFGSNDKLELVGIDSPDVNAISALSATTYFSRMQLHWEHRFSAKTRTKVMLAQGFDKLEFAAAPFLFELRTWPTTLRLDASHDLSEALTLAAGFDGLYAPVRVSTAVPLPRPPGQIPAPNQKDQLVAVSIVEDAWQPAVWTEAVWKPIPDLKLVPGLRLDHNSFIGATWVDPRFAARYTIVEGTTVKGGVGLYHQPPVDQYATEEFGNPDLAEEGSVQYAIGAEQRIWGPLSADLQLYYKDLFDLALATDRTVVRDGQVVPLRYVNEGTGRSYGAELLLRYDPDGRFFGWLAYSLSRTERDQSVIGGGMGGGGDAFDQPHNVIALGSLELPEVWEGLSFGFRLRYATGNPYRRSTGGVYDADGDEYENLPTDLREERLPDFFQLDLRLDKKWSAETWTFTLYLDVQNVTNRENIEGTQYNYDFTEMAFVPGLPIFPSLGLRFEY